MTATPESPLVGRIRACAAKIQSNAITESRLLAAGRRETTAILDAYRLGDRIIEYRARLGQATPFERFDTLPPGALDVRIFGQATWWVDERGRYHRIDDLAATTPERVILLIARLLDEASAHHEAYTRAFPARTVPTDPEAWLLGTALVTALLPRVKESEVCTDQQATCIRRVAPIHPNDGDGA